ncbi:hypothetical protein EOC93_02390 [Mesorhizobium sp. M6A.T.Ce.TU.002.03.1.1]|uniref:hypothetical protein n=1 Tax=Mesorhizobium sp. M6A.T.Ce.TU.002.03.1.1 TaxID=2496782 RepID=UPI000FC9F021|nr:hypothetical protein [Mesorhizobium sp. M6A.T.Ce.TU.002.03.1.1]RUU46639.1 hypothetical protein EOC93_02390 [Mesorhizobium sp. M6A.T.Ce.TU.002.03.1.1]
MNVTTGANVCIAENQPLVKIVSTGLGIAWFMAVCAYLNVFLGLIVLLMFAHQSIAPIAFSLDVE